MSLGVKTKEWCPAGTMLVILVGSTTITGLALWKAIELTGRLYGWILGVAGR
jgi:hypothetical protein